MLQDVNHKCEVPHVGTFCLSQFIHTELFCNGRIKIMMTIGNNT